MITAFHEDKAIIEAQQKTIHKTDPTRRMKAIHHDEALFIFRRKIAKAVEDEKLDSQAAE